MRMLERTPETVKTLTVGAANTPYKSLIVPIFFCYFDSVWSCCSKCDADGLESLQRRTAKFE